MPVQRLTVAYRSRPRPSSTPGAKASTVCPYYLDGDQAGQVRKVRPGDTHLHQLIDVANCAVFKVRRGAPPPGTPAAGLSKLNSVCAAGRGADESAPRASGVSAELGRHARRAGVAMRRSGTL